MNNTDIEKVLLKNKPIANFQYIRRGNAYYMIDCVVVNDRMLNVIFEIPLNDMGEADFKAQMDGNLLLRWIYNTTDKGSWTEFIKIHQDAVNNIMNTL